MESKEVEARPDSKGENVTAYIKSQETHHAKFLDNMKQGRSFADFGTQQNHNIIEIQKLGDSQMFENMGKYNLDRSTAQLVGEDSRSNRFNLNKERSEQMLKVPSSKKMSKEDLAQIADQIGVREDILSDGEPNSGLVRTDSDNTGYYDT